MNKFGVAGAVQSHDQNDYRPGMIEETVWEKDQYDHRSDVINGTV
jgi:hypothetical protein